MYIGIIGGRAPRVQRHILNTASATSGEVACAGIRIGAGFGTFITTPISPSTVAVGLHINILRVTHHQLITEFIDTDIVIQHLSHISSNISPLVIIHIQIFHQHTAIRTSEHPTTLVRKNEMIVRIMTRIGYRIIFAVLL